MYNICEYMLSASHWPVGHVHQLFTTESIGAGQSPFFGQTHQRRDGVRGGEVDVLEMVLAEELMQGVFQHVIVVHLVLGELAMNDMIRLISQKRNTWEVVQKLSACIGNTLNWILELTFFSLSFPVEWQRTIDNWIPGKTYVKIDGYVRF